MLVQGIVLATLLARAGLAADAPERSAAALVRAARSVRPGAAGPSRIADNPDLPSACRGDTVRTVAVETGGRLFAYRYAYRPAEDPDMPVVFNIPGGPGQGSIGMPLSVPYEFGIVRTDPLGAGCNANAALSADALDSEALAAAVLAVVRDLHPRRYVLYGASYGTVVATIAASKARDAGLPDPVAVVLEAVIGRAYRPEESQQGFLAGWTRLKKRLPPGAVRVLSQDPPPLGVAPEIWGGWIQQLLLYGASPGGGDGFAVDALSKLDPAAPEEGRQLVLDMLRQFAQPADAAHVALYRSIVCREIDGATRGQQTDVALRGGELVPLDPGFCGGSSMTRPFDAARYPVSAPIFYFSGGEDPATPEFQTRCHYESQRSAAKTWVSVPTGGHLSLTDNLMDCQDALWKDIAATGGSRFPALLRTCGVRPAPVLRPAE